MRLYHWVRDVFPQNKWFLNPFEVGSPNSISAGGDQSFCGYDSHLEIAELDCSQLSIPTLKMINTYEPSNAVINSVMTTLIGLWRQYLKPRSELGIVVINWKAIIISTIIWRTNWRLFSQVRPAWIHLFWQMIIIKRAVNIMDYLFLNAQAPSPESSITKNPSTHPWRRC